MQILSIVALERIELDSILILVHPQVSQSVCQPCLVDLHVRVGLESTVGDRRSVGNSNAEVTDGGDSQSILILDGRFENGHGFPRCDVRADLVLLLLDVFHGEIVQLVGVDDDGLRRRVSILLDGVQLNVAETQGGATGDADDLIRCFPSWNGAVRRTIGIGVVVHVEQREVTLLTDPPQFVDVTLGHA